VADGVYYNIFKNIHRGYMGYIITYSNELKQMKRNSNRIYNNCHGFNGLFSTTGAEGYIITYSNKYIIEL
jgi:hypothetical protein